MNESNPLLGILGGLAFLSLGLSWIIWPRRFQQMALRSYEGKSGRRYVPFSGFIAGEGYIIGLRLMGCFCVALGLFLLLGSLMAMMRG